MLKVFRLLSSSVARKSTSVLSCLQPRPRARTFADKPHSDASSKQVVAQGNENEQRVRVRRARPADVPRLLRFVREHSRAAWPALLAPTPAPSAAAQLVLADYVSRALAQGHSLVAEQLGARRGWLRVRGLALGAALCPWDAAVLERWARCLRCARSRRLVHFTAHCLREPALHDKYHVHNILQVIMILPPDAASNPEIVQVLARSAIERAREAGFPLLRFDVTDPAVAKALEDMQLNKEWHLAYDLLPEASAAGSEGATRSQRDAPPSKSAGSTVGTATDTATGTAAGTTSIFTGVTSGFPASTSAAPTSSKDRPVNFIAVYTALTASTENVKTKGRGH